MSEIDIRKDSNEMVDKIRFTDHGWIRCNEFLAQIEGDFVRPIGIYKDEVPNLIKALQKYIELYGES